MTAIRKKIGIFIPCYNVEKSIRDVLSHFSPSVLNQIEQLVAVDNLSKDNTFSILREIQQTSALLKSKMVIIKNSENYGLGGSQKIAYQYLIDHQFSHFMIIHGDNQGNGEEIAHRFLDVFQRNPEIDLVLASRFHPQANIAGYSGLRRVGNHFFNVITYYLTGHKMNDAGTGIMFIRAEILKEIPFGALTNSFQFNPQLNIFLYNLQGLKTQEVPLNWRDSKVGSNIQALDYCLTLLKILIRYRMNKTLFKKRGAELFGQVSQAFHPRFDVFVPDIEANLGAHT